MTIMLGVAQFFLYSDRKTNQNKILGLCRPASAINRYSKKYLKYIHKIVVRLT